MNMLTFSLDPFTAHFFPALKLVKLHGFPLLFIHAAYNAIWSPEEFSVTRFLQCKGCLSQSPVLSAALIAAEIQHPRDTAQDQVNFVCTYTVSFRDPDCHVAENHFHTILQNTSGSEKNYYIYIQYMVAVHSLVLAVVSRVFFFG